LGGENGTGTVFSYALGSGGGGGNPTNPPSSGLTLVTNGEGTIEHAAFPSAGLEIGKTYTVTAKPDPKNVFVDWVASGGQSFVSNQAFLKFTMSSGLVLQADFSTNVFLAAQGTYRGLFAPAGSRRQTNSGSFLLNVTGTGTVSGTLDLAGQTVSLSGKFGADGAAVIVSKRAYGDSSLTTTLQLNFDA
jgi:hypothetical protein